MEKMEFINKRFTAARPDGEFELYKDPVSKPYSKNEITDLISYFNENPRSIYRNHRPPWTYLVPAKDVFEFEKKHGLERSPKRLKTTPWLPGIWGEIQKEIAQLRNDPHAHTNYPGRFNRHFLRAEIKAAKKGIQKTKPEKQNEFEKEDGLDQLSKPTPNNLPDPVVEQSPVENKTSPDGFIKKLVLRLESNEEISFQFGPKKVPIALNKLGRKPTIKTIKEIFDGPQNLYSLGQSHDKDRYHRRGQRIRDLSKKFIDIINENFAANIPSDYFLFERRPEYGSGKYKLKLQIVGSIDREKEIEKFREMTLPELKKKLKIFSKNESTRDSELLIYIIDVLKEKGVQQEDFDKLIRPIVRKGEILSLFSEHPPLPDPGMSIPGSSKKTGPPDDDEKVE